MEFVELKALDRAPLKNPKRPVLGRDLSKAPKIIIVRNSTLGQLREDLGFTKIRIAVLDTGEIIAGDAHNIWHQDICGLGPSHFGAQNILTIGYLYWSKSLPDSMKDHWKQTGTSTEGKAEVPPISGWILRFQFSADPGLLCDRLTTWHQFVGDETTVNLDGLWGPSAIDGWNIPVLSNTQEGL